MQLDWKWACCRQYPAMDWEKQREIGRENGTQGYLKWASLGNLAWTSMLFIFLCCITWLERDALHKLSDFMLYVLLMYKLLCLAEWRYLFYLSISQWKEKIPFPSPPPQWLATQNNVKRPILKSKLKKQQILSWLRHWVFSARYFDWF